MIRRFAQFAASHHNKIQFVGYEVANVILVINEAVRSESTYFAPNWETAAALSLLLGSACIWRFDFSLRPAMLFYGGIALTLGGLALVLAGYALTGPAIMLA